MDNNAGKHDVRLTLRAFVAPSKCVSSLGSGHANGPGNSRRAASVSAPACLLGSNPAIHVGSNPVASASPAEYPVMARCSPLMLSPTSTDLTRTLPESHMAFSVIERKQHHVAHLMPSLSLTLLPMNTLTAKAGASESRQRPSPCCPCS
ncbi:hypothetical protein VFPFJ_09474 [Purpureocillium lilacinum]|uniref:Uncharacterized protein n=1 Tax=Purpureocillium lilacinum TaxID=33203 RepID=A0A179GV51_PURLI|nr:hypothetical protein VFPFJ_09474 [Purpureocillium lilacinum]OAQ81019.1 hypothetical protein VFPFJ_09474 [Purpureocillium lilacinum]